MISGSEDVHHQRHARRLRHAAREDRARSRARTAARSSWCPTNLKGFSVAKKLKKIGNKSSDTAELFFDDVRVPKRYLLGEENMGFMYLMQNFQTERLIAAVGARRRRASSRWTHTINYGARARGVRQADHQARGVAAQVRRPLHEARGGPGLHLQVRRPLQRRALREEGAALDGDGEAHLAWRRSSSATWSSEVADECLQFHGGWGYIEDFPIARAWRDQRLLRIGGGTTETMRYYLAKLMGF